MPFDGAFSPIHLLIVGVVALLVLGPDKLPEAARTAGKAWREVRQVRSALLDQVRDFADEVVPSDLRSDLRPTNSSEPADPGPGGTPQLHDPQGPEPGEQTPPSAPDVQ